MLQPPDYPRVSTSYAFDATTARLSTTDVRSVNVAPSALAQQQRESVVRAAVALTLVAHAGEDRYALAVRDAGVLQGEVDLAVDEVGSLMGKMDRLSQDVDSGAPRVELEYLTGVGDPVFDSQTTPVRVVVVANSDRLEFRLSYDTAVLPSLEADWFLSHVTTATASLMDAAASAVLSSVQLSPPSESAILSRYSSNPAPASTSTYPAHVKSLPDFFLHAAQLYPHDPAIHFLPDPTSPDATTGQIILSYADALRAARLLASRLLRILRASLGRTDSRLRSSFEEGNLVIPICVSKSPLLPLALLAISLTGCGYLALEPTFPDDRKRGICEELAERCMLAPVAVVEAHDGEKARWQEWTTEGGTPVVPTLMDAEDVLSPLLKLATSGDTTSAHDADVTSATADEEWPALKETGLAYVIYTSGTTGKPKGIMVEHKQVTAFLRNYRGVFGRGRGERVLQFPSYAFDVSVMNIWDCFAHGSTLCLTTPSALFSSLAQSVLALQCTLVDLTPTIAALLFEHGDAQPRHGETIKDAWTRAGFRIKQVNTGGEKVEKAVREKWRERGVRVVIDYGPTETTVGVISNRSTVPSPASPFALPIGRPTGDTRVAIVSAASLASVPLGVVGEICILGPQVTRGYVLPHLNEGAFERLDGTEGLGEAGEMVYRTGDLGRWVVAEWEEADEREGWVECLGRKDGQVKVNGLRIEVGEIEQNLSAQAHPSLRRGVVDKVESPTLGTALVAFVELSASFDATNAPTLNQSDGSRHTTTDLWVLPAVSSPAFAALVDDIKAHLSRKLPQYMVPRYWLPMNRIPTQGMGKADRKSLRALAAAHDWRGAARLRAQDAGTSGAGRTFTRDEHHQAVRRAWAQVLHLDDAEAHSLADEDDFLKLGGDSIRFMKVVGALRENGYPALRFKDIVHARSISQCAATLVCTARDSDLSPAKPYQRFSLVPADRRDALFAELATASLPSARLDDVYPTAPAQDALLAPSFDSSRGHYYAQAIYPIGVSVASLSFDTLQKAVRDLVQRHEPLRTVFLVSEAAGSVAVVLKPEDDEVERGIQIVQVAVDDAHLDDAVQSAQAWLRADRDRLSFRWGQLHLSFAVFETPSGVRKLGWGMHHAMSDGWTLELLTADLRSLCSSIFLPSRPAFSSIVAWWQGDVTTSGETLDFWREYLAAAERFNWPSQHALCGEQLATTGTSVLHWSGLLPNLAQNGVTPAIASRLAVSLALASLTANRDVTVGIVRSGRDIDVPGAEDVVGPCVSVLPSRTRWCRNPPSSPSSSLLSFAEAEASFDRLARVHQRISLSDLARACGSSDDRSRPFDILVTYQSLAEHDPAWDAAAPWPVRQPPERIHMPTNYALSFEITPSLTDGTSLELACFFDERIASQKSVDAVLAAVGTVLDHLVSAPCTDVEEMLEILKDGGPAVSLQVTRSNAVLPREKVLGDLPPQALAALTASLRSAWALTLRLDEAEVGEDDAFASLGGDSIATMRLAVRLQKIGLPVPTQHLAKLPTIQRQVEWLASKGVYEPKV
ncbi:hypothetical protein JCM10207_000129 [Rhodosporidiobolus poonsookiae]